MAAFTATALTRHSTGSKHSGEIGQVQMLPKDIIENGMDGDGDGVVDLKGSSPAKADGART